MIEYPYLIALALIEQEGKRLMPLGGKSLKEEIKLEEDPVEIAETLVKELLLRIFQRSEDGSLRRASGDRSLLLIQVPMLEMQGQIPLLKSKWIESGDDEKLCSELIDICQGVWSLTFSRNEGTKFSRLG